MRLSRGNLKNSFQRVRSNDGMCRKVNKKRHVGSYKQQKTQGQRYHTTSESKSARLIICVSNEAFDYELIWSKCLNKIMKNKEQINNYIVRIVFTSI